MGQVLQFTRREFLAIPPPRTAGDDDGDTSAWVAIAQEWGWQAKTFKTTDGLSGYLIHHNAVGAALPLFVLIRMPDIWKLWSRQREMTEFETLDEALQSVFPTDLAPPPEKH